MREPKSTQKASDYSSLPKTFLELLLDEVNLTKSVFSELTGFSPSRVSYLTDRRVCKGFPLHEIPHIVSVLNLTDEDLCRPLIAYLEDRLPE